MIALGTGGAYAAAQIGADDIKRNAVRSKHIKRGNVKRSDLRANAVNSAKVANGSLDGTDILDGSLLGTDLAGSQINSAHIVDGQVSTADMADGAISAAKLGDGQVTNSKLAGDAVDSAKLANGSVRAEDLGVWATSAGLGNPANTVQPNACLSFTPSVAPPEARPDDVLLVHHGTDDTTKLPQPGLELRASLVNDAGVLKIQYSLCNRTTSVLNAPANGYAGRVIGFRP
jgi:hypothetical protein